MKCGCKMIVEFFVKTKGSVGTRQLLLGPEAPVVATILTAERLEQYMYRCLIFEKGSHCEVGGTGSNGNQSTRLTRNANSKLSSKIETPKNFRSSFRSKKYSIRANKFDLLFFENRCCMRDMALQKNLDLKTSGHNMVWALTFCCQNLGYAMRTFQ